MVHLDLHKLQQHPCACIGKHSSIYAWGTFSCSENALFSCKEQCVHVYSACMYVYNTKQIYCCSGILCLIFKVIAGQQLVDQIAYLHCMMLEEYLVEQLEDGYL